MRLIILLVLSVGILDSSSGQINQKLKNLKKEVSEVKKVTAGSGLSGDEISSGLKEALLKGVKKGSDKASEVDGFLKNPAIKIPFPKDARKVADALKRLGMEKEVKRFVKTLNRSAEMAAKEAKPIFVDAIKEMSIEDAWSVLNGEDKQGATNYLKNSTSEKLTKKITPIVTSSLEKTSATKYYKDLIERYNKLPMVKKKDPDLTAYATRKTLNGLFYLVGEEEAKIRNNPAERTTDVLKKVFEEG